ncbi:MAG: HAMP domain-containing histidine kinase [Candidatus Obscuribacterales bacterium]|nr:HAMP domain-containing histidine kinase [Candidatus Obscuribacterales bacterium]
MQSKNFAEPDDLLLKRVRQNIFLSFVFCSTSLLIAGVLSCAFNTFVLSKADDFLSLNSWLSWQIAFVLVFFILSIFIGRLIAIHSTKQMSRHLSLMRAFTQDAGHELANPVAIASSHIEVLERELSEKGISSLHMSFVRESMERISRLVSDLRFLAKAQVPLRQASLSIMRMDDLVNDCVSYLQPDFNAKQIELSVVASGNCSLVGDKEGWSRVAMNLIENALKYCQIGKTVNITVTEQSKNLEFTVSDNGKGISEEDLPNIFDRFFRADAQQAIEQKGNGLGLAIVKAVVDTHGGSVFVESRVGEGTKFFVLIPKAPLVHPMAVFLAEESRING